MRHFHRVIIGVGLLLCLTGGEANADRFTRDVGSGGASWSDLAIRWVALDDTTVPGAIQPKELRPWENVMSGEGEARNIFELAWHNRKDQLEVFGHELGINPRVWPGHFFGDEALAFLDGDSTTATRVYSVVSQEEFDSHASLTGGAFASGFRQDWRETYTLDLGITVPVERIRFYPPQTGLDDQTGVPKKRLSPQGFELSIQRYPEDYLLLGTEPISQIQPLGALENVILRTLYNSESIVDLEIPLQPLRFIRLNVGILRQLYTMAELEVYGRGVPPEVEYVSGAIDMGEPVNFGAIEYSFRRVRRTDSDELIDDPDAPVTLRLQTKSGHDSSPAAYFIISELGTDVEATPGEYQAARDPKSCCQSLRLPGVRSAITEDETNWTGWSSPYSGSGDQNRSADGRRYLQFRFEMETDDVLAYGILDSLRFEYSPLLAQSVVSEVSLVEDPEMEVIEVPAGEERRFALDVRAEFGGSGQVGFDAVRLEVPPDSRYVGLEMEEAATGFAPVPEDSVHLERTALTVFFSSNRIDRNNNKPVRITLDAAVVNSSTVITGDVIALDSDLLPQSLDAGDANPEVAGNTLTVYAVEGTLDILVDVAVTPSVLTPNRDNINDNVTITYSLQKIETGDVEMAIYDLNGRRVVDLSPGERGQGTFVETWKGTDDDGATVMPGIYLCRIAVVTESGCIETMKLIPVAY